MNELNREQCVRVKKGSPPLSQEEINLLLTKVEGWQVISSEGLTKLQKTFSFRQYREALDFSMAVGLAAEEQDHHPTIIIEYGKVTIEWWTHVVYGLHRNDFIMAAKTDEIYRTGNYIKSTSS